MAAGVRLSALRAGGGALVQALLQRCGAGEAAGVLLALNQRQRDLASVGGRFGTQPRGGGAAVALGFLDH